MPHANQAAAGPAEFINRCQPADESVESWLAICACGLSSMPTRLAGLHLRSGIPLSRKLEDRCLDRMNGDCASSQRKSPLRMGLDGTPEHWARTTKY